MNSITPPLNKRTALGGQFWTLGALGALTVHGVPMATLLVAVGVHLVFAPVLGAGRVPTPSGFLLSPE